MKTARRIPRQAVFLAEHPRRGRSLAAFRIADEAGRHQHRRRRRAASASQAKPGGFPKRAARAWAGGVGAPGAPPAPLFPPPPPAPVRGGGFFR